jgi:hypothetical protein
LIDELNSIQFVNCYANVYGNEKMTEQYVRKLYERCRNFPKANIIKSKTYGSKESANGIIRISFLSDCRTNLKLPFVFLSTYASRFDFSERYLAYPRAHAATFREFKRKGGRIDLGLRKE